MMHIKRTMFFVLVIVIVLLVSLPACGSGNTSDAQSSQADGSSSTTEEDDTSSNPEEPAYGSDIEADVEIKEKLFIEQINDIYLNPDDYMGKTIKYEGVFEAFEYEPPDRSYYYVVRYGPGCCGTDGVVGFEIVWDGEYPDYNDWVEVVGIIEPFDEYGYDTVRMVASSLLPLPYRGEENVGAPE